MNANFQISIPHSNFVAAPLGSVEFSKILEKSLADEFQGSLEKVKQIGVDIPGFEQTRAEYLNGINDIDKWDFDVVQQWWQKEVKGSRAITSREFRLAVWQNGLYKAAASRNWNSVIFFLENNKDQVCSYPLAQHLFLQGLRAGRKDVMNHSLLTNSLRHQIELNKSICDAAYAEGKQPVFLDTFYSSIEITPLKLDLAHAMLVSASSHGDVDTIKKIHDKLKTAKIEDTALIDMMSKALQASLKFEDDRALDCLFALLAPVFPAYQLGELASKALETEKNPETVKKILAKQADQVKSNKTTPPFYYLHNDLERALTHAENGYPAEIAELLFQPVKLYDLSQLTRLVAEASRQGYSHILLHIVENKMLQPSVSKYSTNNLLKEVVNYGCFDVVNQVSPHVREADIPVLGSAMSFVLTKDPRFSIEFGKLSEQNMNLLKNWAAASSENVLCQKIAIGMVASKAARSWRQNSEIMSFLRASDPNSTQSS